MNQKQPTTDTITKKDLTLILDSIHKLENSIHKLENSIHKLENNFGKLENNFGKLEEDFKKYRNENMNRLDDVMAEFQTIREDNTIGTYQIHELRKNLDDHEKRLTKIEKKPAN